MWIYLIYRTRTKKKKNTAFIYQVKLFFDEKKNNKTNITVVFIKKIYKCLFINVIMYTSTTKGSKGLYQKRLKHVEYTR